MKIIKIIIQQYCNTALMLSIDVGMLCIKAVTEPRLEFRGPQGPWTIS